MKQYEPIRQQLTNRQAEIQNRVNRMTQDIRHARTPLDADFEEPAVERENDQVLDALDESLRAELSQIQITLGRLDRGEYGVCEDCGHKIPTPRLAALLFTSR